jgi:hypothetical protein
LATQKQKSPPLYQKRTFNVLLSNLQTESSGILELRLPQRNKPGFAVYRNRSNFIAGFGAARIVIQQHGFLFGVGNIYCALK